MLKMSQIQTFTQKSDFIQTTFDLQTFAENLDQSGWPAIVFRLISTKFRPKSDQNDYQYP